MPELVYEKAEDVPAVLKDIAKEVNGKFVANVVPKSELDDFRNRNIEISKTNEKLTGAIGRLTTDVKLDPEKLDEFVDHFKELEDTHQQVADGKLVKDTSLKDAVEAKTGEMRRSYEEKLRGLETSNKELVASNEGLKRDNARSTIDHQMMIAINDPKSGALPEATSHILRSAYDMFTVDENKQLVPKDKDGNVVYGSDGATPMKPLEYLAKLQESDPFFFKQAQGGGSGGGGGPAGSLTPAQLANMSPEDKMTYGREHGLDGRR